MSVLQTEHDELRVKWNLVLNTLQHEPARLGEVMQDVESQSSELVVTTIHRRFGPAMKWGKRGRSIRRGADVMYRLAMAYSGARRFDRNLLLENAVAELFALADTPATLESIGGIAPRFVLNGTPQQLFIAALSSRIGRYVPELPASIRDHLAAPFIDALTIVVQVGAPAVRDAALEGLGALLKHFRGNRSFALPRLDRRAMQEADPRINQSYDDWFRLSERIVKSLAGDDVELQRYHDEFKQPAAGNHARCALLTRALPAMLRQSALSIDEVMDCIAKAAAFGQVDFESSFKTQTEVARYQESVFLTIDLLLEENGVDASAFDEIVAGAMARIPETLLGPLELCNAQARATVAILRTAAKVASRLRGSKTDDAIRARYTGLQGEHTEWMNPGILEGWFRGLPFLLLDHTHDYWTKDVLKNLFSRLRATPSLSSYVEMHSRLCANAAFRQILLMLNERMHQQFLEFEPNVDETVRERAVENAMRSLVENPTPKRVLDVFHEKRFQHAGERPLNVSEVVVSATALETSLLYRSELLFEEWTRLSDAQQLLIVRILGCQLRAASRERVQIEQYPLVKRVLRRLSSVEVDDIARDEMLWELLSRIPPRAADAAEGDIQEFVEFRTSHFGDTDHEQATGDVDDLPGYVLAMVSDQVSDRLAGDIARQVLLNLHRAKHHPDFDFADPLYQILLRNPGTTIFDHLLAQIPEHGYRTFLLLFREHVTRVHAALPTRPGEEVKINELIAHAETLSPKLLWHHQSFALRELGDAMRLYIQLASDKPAIWKAIVGMKEDDRDGGLGELFRVLDRLDEETHRRHHDIGQPRLRTHKQRRRRDAPAQRRVMRRVALAKLCNEECVTLRLEVEHYLRLPIGRFDECSRALNLAIGAVRRIREKLFREAGLQPPELVILDSMLERWEGIFDRTLQWYVDAPRRCVHARRKKLFWLSFTNLSKDKLPPPEPVTEVELSHFHAAGDYTAKAPPDRTPALPHCEKPPVPPGQDVAFENFFVEWMASDLDVDHLRWALGPRWKHKYGFRAIYFFITSLPLTLLVIAFPFVINVLMHFTDQPELEGIGFFVFVVALILFATIAIIERLLDERRPVRTERPYYAFRFTSLLPRLFRLIVVPLGLLIDFEHSYLFPMHASNVELLGLCVLALVAPHFFIRREVRSSEGELSRMDDRENSEDVGRRVRQILSVALAHSFAVALLFAFLFEAKYISRIHVADTAHQTVATGGKQADAAPDPHHHYHHEPYFLGFIPREAHFDLDDYARRYHYQLREPWATWLRFEFYPTLILSWSALGLFFGVFLEGFLRGERLRGAITSGSRGD